MVPTLMSVLNLLVLYQVLVSTVASDDTFEGYIVYEEHAEEKVFAYALTEACSVQKFGTLYHAVVRDPYLPNSTLIEDLGVIHGNANLKIVN